MISPLTVAVRFESSSVMFFASSKGIKRLQSLYRVIIFPFLAITRATAPLTLLSLPVISSCITSFFHWSRGNLLLPLIITMSPTMSLLNESYFLLLYVWCSRKLFIYSWLNRFQKCSIVIFKYLQRLVHLHFVISELFKLNCSKNTFIWDPKWTQTALKYRSVYMAIYMEISLRQLSKQ